MSDCQEPIAVIKPASGWQFIEIKELRQYRDLLYFFIWKNVKTRYAQTILGFSWAIIAPLVQIILFTVIFGKVAKLSSDGIPYALFSSVAVIPWSYMSDAMAQSSASLVTGKHMLGKIYFPRIIFPISPILSKLVDFGISMVILMILLIYYKVMPSWNLLLFPFFLFLATSFSAAFGIWFSAMAIRFRDVNHAMPFLVRMLMYTAPIIYSASSIPEKYRIIYSLNPIVGIIEGFRACLLGTSVPWQYIWPGIITLSVVLLTGIFYFKRMEPTFVDVI